MTDISKDTLSCPFCGEKILKSAKICRFCKHNVSVDIFIEHIPAGTNLGEVARLIHEKGPKHLFQGFGHLRKKLSEGLFVSDAKPEDAEKISHLFDQFAITSIEKNHTGNKSSSFLPLNSILLLLGVIGVGSLLFFFLYQPEQSGFSSSPTLIEATPGSVIGEPTSEPENQPTFSPPSPSAAQTHANIESLLISTATISTGSGSGSAFFVTREGHLISNQHVTKNEKEVDVLTFDKKRYRGKVIRSLDFYDLSLIKIENNNYPPLRLGDATKLHQGDTVWTIGAPHGLEFSVTKGIVSYVGRNVNGKAFVQSDADINPGNSGGPMINDNGEVIGINNFIIKQTAGLNFAIPVNYLYSGTSPILEGIVQTTPDMGLMATWRSWEKQDARNTMTADSSPDSSSSKQSPSSNQDMAELSKELKTIEQRFTTNQKKFDSELSALDQKIALVNSQYTNSQTVSDQEKIGQSLRKLQIEKIDVEIKKIEDNLDYHKAASAIMVRAKLLNISDPTLSQHYTQELEKLSRGKSEAESAKATKQQQRLSLQTQQF